jgi:hypothetical protein
MNTSTIKAVLTDLARLKNYTLAASTAALIIEIISPLGINAGSTGTIITAVLVVVGFVASVIEKQKGTATVDTRALAQAVFDHIHGTTGQ